MTRLMSNPSWEFTTKTVSQLRRGEEEPELVTILDWAPVVEEVVIRHDDEGEDVLARQYLVRVHDHTQLVSHRDLQSGDCWQFFPQAGGLSKPIYPILSAIVTQQAVAASSVLGRPKSTADGLKLPPDRYLPGGYGAQKGDAEGLSTLVTALSPFPYPSLLLGLSAVSHLVRPAGLQPAWWTLLGDTTTAKTTTLRAISALWGTPQHVVRGFSGTLNGIAGHLRDLCVLPAFWDELGASDMKPSQTLSFVMSTCEGAQRNARNRDDTARKSGSWYSYAFATGNRPLTEASSPGLGARLIEIPFTRLNPAIPPQFKRDVQQATNLPTVAGCWIGPAQEISPDQFLMDLEAMSWMEELTPPDQQVGMHMVKHLAAALVGCDYLQQATGITQIFDSALEAAKKVLAATADRVADMGGGDPAEELVAAVMDDMARRPAQWQKEQDPREERRTDFLGYMEDGVINVRIPVLPEIAKRAGIESYKVCLQELRDQGRLLTTPSKGYRRQIREADLQLYVYSIVPFSNGTNGTNGTIAGQGHVLPVPSTAPNGTNGTKIENVTAPDIQTAPQTAPRFTQPDLGERDSGAVGAVGAVKNEDHTYRTDEQIVALRNVLEDATLSDEILLPALLRWHDTVKVGNRSITLSPIGGGQTGANAYRLLQSRQNTIPLLDERATINIARPSTTANWMHPEAAQRLAWANGTVTAVDVNAQFLAAASSTEYPLGTPEKVNSKDFTGDMFKFPGYVRLAEASPWPLPYDKDSWVAMPVARYLHELKRLPEISEALVWREHRRVLAPWAKVFREARQELLSCDDDASKLALRAVKSVSNRFLSGWMVSEAHNKTEFMRPEWCDMTIGTARANAMRAVSKSDTTGLLGVFTDTVFYAGGLPEGLEYSDKPGKWKHVGTVTVQPEALMAPQKLFKAVRNGLG